MTSDLPCGPLPATPMCLFCTNPSLESTPEQLSFCRTYQTHVLSEATRAHHLHNAYCDSARNGSEIEHYLFHGTNARAFLYGTHFGKLDKSRHEQPASKETKFEVLKLHLKICFYAVRRKGMAAEKAVNEVEKFYWGHIWDVAEWSDWSEEGAVGPEDVIAYIQELAGMDVEIPVGLHWRLDVVLEQMGEAW